MPLDLDKTNESFSADQDGIAIKHYVHGLEGGRVLDMTGYPDDYVHEGHGVILDGSDYKPQPVDGSEHAKLVGVVRSTTRKSVPSTGVMTQGTINNAVLKYPFNANSLAQLKLQGIYNQED